MMAFSLFQSTGFTREIDVTVTARLIQSESGKRLFTWCGLACLGNTDYGARLFRETVQHAFSRRKTPPDDVELWLFSSLHPVWLDFPRGKPGLTISAAPIRLDWSRTRPHQGRDALYMLTPPEREIFLYRFFCTFSTPRIACITGIKPTVIHTLFARAMGKVVR